MCSELRFLAALLVGGIAAAQPPATPLQDAVARAFPEATVERRTTTIDDERRQRIAALSGDAFEPGVVFSYVVRDKGAVIATVYFDRHRVRTKGELLMITITPKNEIGTIEVIAFAEPKDYQPQRTWYAQFDGRKLDDDLQLKHGIDGVSGATLTARATTAAARRTLALHQVLTAAATSPGTQPAPPQRK